MEQTNSGGKLRHIVVFSAELVPEQSMSKRETVTLELDREAIAAAKAQGLDLSAVLLEALHRRLPELHAEQRAKSGRRWLERNREAIDSMNRLTEEDGFVFSDGARSF